MVFSNPSFLFYLLPITLALYWVVGWRKRNFFLLIVSLLFYIAGGGALVMLLVASGLLTYSSALLIDRTGIESKRKLTQRITISVLLASLLFWKYSEFMLAQFLQLLSSFGNDTNLTVDVILPIAISFYTFQCISYLVDVSRREIEAEVNVTTFLCYLFFFPHLLAGPVVRYRDVALQLATKPTERFSAFVIFSPRFFLGLAKKVLIADQAAHLANAAFGIAGYQVQASDTVIGVVAYSIQIYFDFSGYSDMAIALAGMFGIRFQENFQRPYSATSVTDFWRRWHISLSSWFRDYLYIPLGGNRSGSFRTYRNLVIVFALTGFWHGANWTFLTWGLVHGLALILERLFLKDVTLRRKSSRFFVRFWTLLVEVFGWLFFRADNLSHAVEMLIALKGGSGFGLSQIVLAAITPQRVFWTSVGLTTFFLSTKQSFGEKLIDGTSHLVLRSTAVLAGLLASIYVLSSSFSPFLYFQF